MNSNTGCRANKNEEKVSEDDFYAFTSVTHACLMAVSKGTNQTRVEPAQDK